MRELELRETKKDGVGDQVEPWRIASQVQMGATGVNFASELGLLGYQYNT